MLRAVCVADVEEPGIPALELRPESLVEHRTTNSNRWMPSQPIASWTTPCSSRNVMESGTRTRRQIIGLIPSSRTLSRTFAPGSAADFTNSMTENCALPRDSIKIDPTEFCASQIRNCARNGPVRKLPARGRSNRRARLRSRYMVSVSSDGTGTLMLVGAESVFCVSRATVLAAVLALGALPAHADGFGAQSALDGPAMSLLSGVQPCEPTLQD